MEIDDVLTQSIKINGFMTQKIKFSLYGFLFRFFSFFADKTGGNILFVKPKILLGSLILGLSSGACSTVPINFQSENKNDVQSQLDENNEVKPDTNANRGKTSYNHQQR